MTGPPKALLPSSAIHLMFLSLPSSVLHRTGTFLSIVLIMFRCGVPPNMGASVRADFVSPGWAAATGWAAFWGAGGDVGAQATAKATTNPNVQWMRCMEDPQGDHRSLAATPTACGRTRGECIHPG